MAQCLLVFLDKVHWVFSLTVNTTQVKKPCSYFPTKKNGVDDLKGFVKWSGYLRGCLEKQIIYGKVFSGGV